MITINGEEISGRWDEYGVEDLEGNIEEFDDIDEALDVILMRRALYGPGKEGQIVVRQVLAGPWKRSEKQPAESRPGS